MALLAVAGERLGIDRVGLAEDAEGADERLDLAGVGAVRGATGLDPSARASVRAATRIAAPRLSQAAALYRLFNGQSRAQRGDPSCPHTRRRPPPARWIAALRSQ